MPPLASPFPMVALPGMASLATLARAQAERALTLPTQALAPQPLREGALEAVRQRNAVLDWLFYDLGALDPDQAAMLAPRYAAEGAILRVMPGADAGGDGAVQFWPDFDAFRVTGLPADARTLVVAGVGSSALGAAAFARNVADATAAPVLAVVSGYGLADLVAEGMGGFALFAWAGGLRSLLEPLDDLTRPSTPRFGGPAGAVAGASRASLDTRTLAALLATRDFDLLVGHSKGNLVISEALTLLAGADPARATALAESLHIVTIGARVHMPQPFWRITDVMGALDTFGAANSRLELATDVVVPAAWHHTNTELPLHLPVTRTLRDILGR